MSEEKEFRSSLYTDPHKVAAGCRFTAAMVDRMLDRFPDVDIRCFEPPPFYQAYPPPLCRIHREFGPKIRVSRGWDDLREDVRASEIHVEQALGDVLSLCFCPLVFIDFHFQVDSDINFLGQFAWHKFIVFDIPYEA